MCFDGVQLAIHIMDPLALRRRITPGLPIYLMCQYLTLYYLIMQVLAQRPLNILKIFTILVFSLFQ